MSSAGSAGFTSDLGERPRILIIKLSAVGDVIHALPVLDSLRRQLPEARIGWAVQGGAADLLREHPQLDELFVVPRRLTALSAVRSALGAIRSTAWDVALDLQGLTKSGLVALASGARRRVGFAGSASRELNGWFMGQKVPPPEDVSVLHLNLSLLSALGLDPGAYPPRAVVPERDADLQYVQKWASHIGIDGERFLIMDPFAGWPTKLWPKNFWGELAREVQNQTGLRWLIFYGPGERVAAEELGGMLRRDYGVASILPPETTLGQATALLRIHGAAFAGGDTGPSHLASALGIPTLALYGPSCGRRNGARFENARLTVLQDESHPCTGTFRRQCPLHQGQDPCMARLKPQAATEALLALLRPESSTA
jgi:ADP-heptose:LPS heptosyltransferase